MAAIAARAFVDIVSGPGLLGLAVRDKSDVGLIVNVISTVEYLRPLADRVQQAAQCRHRTVVQVRCAEPDPVQKRGDITTWLGLDETAKFNAENSHFLVRIDCSLLATCFA